MDFGIAQGVHDGMPIFLTIMVSFRVAFIQGLQKSLSVCFTVASFRGQIKPESTQIGLLLGLMQIF